MSAVYYIGGSPCSGKSTIAEMLAKTYDFTYFKYDDYLFKYLNKASCAGKPVSSICAQMALDDLWLRDPDTLAAEALALYHEYFEYVQADITALGSEKPIIAEGAGLLPMLLASVNITPARCICIVPTYDFQYRLYSERTWVGQYLQECSQPEQAFENWMKRDGLFASIIKTQAERLGYPVIVVDGLTPVSDIYKAVKTAFGLADITGK